MSSTDPDQALREFFQNVLLPLAKKCEAEGASTLELQADADAESYYVKRVETTTSREVFESASGMIDEATLREAMQAFWKSQGDEDLAAIAGPLAKLAQQLKTTEEQNEEVSPFIYAMY